MNEIRYMIGDTEYIRNTELTPEEFMKNIKKKFPHAVQIIDDEEFLKQNYGLACELLSQAMIEYHAQAGYVSPRGASICKDIEKFLEVR